MSIPPPSPTCSFCNIAKAYPPIPPTNNQTALPFPPNSPNTPQPTTHLILSTKHVIAFLDIMPLTQGHILVLPRSHYEKLSDIDIPVSRELGQWLPIISRVVMRTLSGNDDAADWDWNVVQNNGIVVLRSGITLSFY
ncbi:hypothetical protein BDV28DRAFT_134441 [Aspergillus coremiiformis]|uniref:HIT domain-containing protein n=1 Tax=Aspergillus coremiiformis TaxID=138285 RepID=A0A5N6Z576_9EURO|nr:hypothetical protein BDV28DRAFT_134441 [Aspergillus coremiiformis]